MKIEKHDFKTICFLYFSAKDILTQLTKNKPLKEVNMPMHKFSRAYETSFHMDTLKSGATAEGNVVFNPEGKLKYKTVLFNCYVFLAFFFCLS